MRVISPAILVLLLSAVIADGGCVAGSEGLQGVYTFYDQTPPAEHEFPWDSNRELARPLAVGATLHLRVTYRGFSFRPTSVEATPPSMASVVDIVDDGFILKGIASGQVRVRVEGATRWDEIDVDVRKADAERLDVRPWNWYPLPLQFIQNGMAVLVGQSGWLFGAALSQGRELTGHGQSEIVRTSAGDAIEHQEMLASNFVKLTAQAPGEETFLWGMSDPVTVHAVTEDDIDDVAVLEAWNTQSGAMDCRVGDTLYVMVVPFDVEGRIIVGTTTGESPVSDIGEEYQAIIEDTTPADLDGDLRELLQNRTVFLRCRSAGAATATISWRDFSREIQITVEPRS
jgi:hypothetical protein